MAQWLSQLLRDMKYTVYDLDAMGLNPGWIELGSAVILPKSSFNQR